jgi:hypothetical protein
VPWREWEGRGDSGNVFAWNPEYVDSEDDFDEGLLCARTLGTLEGRAHMAMLVHVWVLFHDDWDYELIDADQAMDIQLNGSGAVLHSTLLIRV